MSTLFLGLYQSPGVQTTVNSTVKSAVAAVVKPSKSEWTNPAPGAVLTFWQQQRTVDPVTGQGINKCHSALDMAGPVGSPIVAPRDGVVVFADETDLGYGWMLILRHQMDDGTIKYTMYGHNDSLLVKRGQVVKRGQPIARMGNTGWSEGAHLHWSIFDNLGNTFPVNYLPRQWGIKVDVNGYPEPPKDCAGYVPKIGKVIQLSETS